MTTLDEIRAALAAAEHSNSLDLRLMMVGTETVHKLEAIRRLFNAAPVWLAELCGRLEVQDGLIVVLDSYKAKIAGLEETGTALYERAIAAEARVADLEIACSLELRALVAELVPRVGPHPLGCDQWAAGKQAGCVCGLEDILSRAHAALKDEQ